MLRCIWSLDNEIGQSKKASDPKQTVQEEERSQLGGNRLICETKQIPLL